MIFKLSPQKKNHKDQESSVSPIKEGGKSDRIKGLSKVKAVEQKKPMNLAIGGETPEFFSTLLLDWGQTHGRTGLPWQCKEPYKVWLSEIMLQQTQVETVKGYYARFLKTLPDVKSLAEAPEETVLELWAGLGYYQRARNLQSAAKMVMSDFDGEFPQTTDDLIKLPGIGPSTAAAIASICFEKVTPILDGNVQRVIGRVLGLKEDLAGSAGQKVYWAKARALMAPIQETQTQLYTQSIMDMGATVCLPKSPKCESCPLSSICVAFSLEQQDKYPVKTKKKKERPFKNAHWHIIHDGTHVLVLKNEEEKGVWRQMWTFPVREYEPFMITTSLDSSSQQADASISVPLSPPKKRKTQKDSNQISKDQSLKEAQDPDTPILEIPNTPQEGIISHRLTASSFGLAQSVLIKGHLKHVFSHYDLYLSVSNERVSTQELDDVLSRHAHGKKVLWETVPNMAIPQPMHWALGLVSPSAPAIDSQTVVSEAGQKQKKKVKNRAIKK